MKEEETGLPSGVAETEAYITPARNKSFGRESPAYGGSVKK
jgi:hypothetical protein